MARFDLVAYLKLIRFPLVFTAMSDSVSGYMVIWAHAGTRLSTSLLLMGTSAGLYFFGMALNDLSDRAKDREAAPNKVIPSGRVSPAGGAVVCGLALVGSLACLLSISSGPVLARLIVWGLALVSILAYDLHWVKAPPIMGLVRSFNFLLGATVVDQIGFDSTIKPWELAVVVMPEFVYVSALTYVSTLEDGEVNRSKLLWGSSLMALGALAAGMLLPLWTSSYLLPDLSKYLIVVQDRWHGLVYASILAGWTLYRASRARDKRGVMLMVRDGVGGIILMNAAIVASMVGAQKGAMIAALVLPAALSVSVFKRLA